MKITELNIEKFRDYYSEVNTEHIKSVIAIEVTPDEYYGDFNYDIYAKNGGSDYYLWASYELNNKSVEQLKK